MMPRLELQHIQREQYNVRLFIPDPVEVQQYYHRQWQQDANTPFPHWAKLWPASLAMSDFLMQHPALIRNKTVLELAAGLGLPSIMAASYARSVCCSDYLPEAVATIRQSAAYNQLYNLECQVLDWYALPDNLEAEILLLSDINYDPTAFEQLYLVLSRFIAKNTTILLSTPQRLMAKPFIERLLPWCQQQEEIAVREENGQQTLTSMLILAKH